LVWVPESEPLESIEGVFYRLDVLPFAQKQCQNVEVNQSTDVSCEKSPSGRHCFVMRRLVAEGRDVACKLCDISAHVTAVDGVESFTVTGCHC